ncbi:MAG TPA: hypothetical protein ENK34_01715 [Rhodobacteraceae bacterium]|nr:hypothetical protein [Paracoccaceae bacterium]
MAFRLLTENEKALLRTYEELRTNHDRQELVALAAERDVAWIDEAASVVLSASPIRKMRLRERAYIEASFAVPRADALERLANAADAIERAESTLSDLRSIFDGGRDA